MNLMIGLILLAVLYVYFKVIPERKFDNYVPPDGYRVNHTAVINDLNDGLSQADVKRNITNGVYNVKK